MYVSTVVTGGGELGGGFGGGLGGEGNKGGEAGGKGGAGRQMHWRVEVQMPVLLAGYILRDDLSAECNSYTQPGGGVYHVYNIDCGV